MGTYNPNYKSTCNLLRGLKKLKAYKCNANWGYKYPDPPSIGPGGLEFCECQDRKASLNPDP